MSRMQAASPYLKIFYYFLFKIMLSKHFGVTHTAIPQNIPNAHWKGTFLMMRCLHARTKSIAREAVTLAAASHLPSQNTLFDINMHVRRQGTLSLFFSPTHWEFHSKLFEMRALNEKWSSRRKKKLGAYFTWQGRAGGAPNFPRTHSFLSGPLISRRNVWRCLALVRADLSRPMSNLSRTQEKEGDETSVHAQRDSRSLVQ